jgi:hypothetical protein
MDSCRGWNEFQRRFPVGGDAVTAIPGAPRESVAWYLVGSGALLSGIALFLDTLIRFVLLSFLFLYCKTVKLVSATKQPLRIVRIV